MFPGRWNHKGQRVIYTSLSLSTAVLETLAHLDKTEIPDNYVKMEIEISFPPPSEETAASSRLHLRKTSTTPWQRFMSVHQSIAAAQADLDTYKIHRERFEIARLIPSVIVPEYNVVLNPASKFFQRLVKLVSVEPFEFDPRLFPERASKGTSETR
jgi:RES domain-containing protein